MEYRERDGQMFRGEKTPMFKGLKVPRMTEWLVSGQWQPVKGDFGLKAALYGAAMTEDEAREFAGDDWPQDDSREPQSAGDQPKSETDSQK
jgi:hypothetical protein